jgi:hypothetical protein
MDKSEEELFEIGEEKIFDLKKLFETVSMNGFLDKKTVEKMLKRYVERM